MNWRKLFSFAGKIVLVHTVTCWVAGMISFILVLRPYVIGDEALTWYCKDPQAFAPRVIPAQLLRGLFLAIAFYPLLPRILELGKKGGLLIAGIYLLVGQFACPGAAPGALEGFVYTRIPQDFQLAVLPEITAQGFVLGYLVCFWARRSERRGGTARNGTETVPGTPTYVTDGIQDFSNFYKLKVAFPADH